MKGYLERMVAIAARPHATIHPSVGSLFASASREPVADRLAQREDFILRDAVAARAARNVSGLTHDAIPQDVAAGEGWDVRPMVAGGAERAPLELLLPRQQREAAAPSLRARAGADETAPGSQPAHTGEARPEMKSSEDWSVDRLVAAELVVNDGLPGPAGMELARSLRHNVSERQGPGGTTSAPRLGAEPASHAVSLAREPDEIQIHIGRIEVTAVPQATRPSPAPARKATSLDDYLRRRDGRAG